MELPESFTRFAPPTTEQDTRIYIARQFEQFEAKLFSSMETACLNAPEGFDQEEFLEKNEEAWEERRPLVKLGHLNGQAQELSIRSDLYHGTKRLIMMNYELLDKLGYLRVANFWWRFIAGALLLAHLCR